MKKDQNFTQKKKRLYVGVVVALLLVIAILGYTLEKKKIII